MLEILNVTIKVIKPINMSPDGKLLNNGKMCRPGGTIYYVECKDKEGLFTLHIQREENEWYEPVWMYHSESLIKLCNKVRSMDLDYEAHCLAEQQASKSKEK